MSLNHYVTLGRSGLKVSPVCLGAMTFGQEWGFGADEATAARLMDRFIERGGNFIDTANIYTGGHSERIIGNHIGRDAAKRDGRGSSPKSRRDRSMTTRRCPTKRTTSLPTISPSDRPTPT